MSLAPPACVTTSTTSDGGEAASVSSPATSLVASCAPTITTTPPPNSDGEVRLVSSPAVSPAAETWCTSAPGRPGHDRASVDRQILLPGDDVSANRRGGTALGSTAAACDRQSTRRCFLDDDGDRATQGASEAKAARIAARSEPLARREAARIAARSEPASTAGSAYSGPQRAASTAYSGPEQAG